jgi:hypothetical protein
MIDIRPYTPTGWKIHKEGIATGQVYTRIAHGSKGKFKVIKIKGKYLVIESQRGFRQWIPEFRFLKRFRRNV